MDTTTPQTPNTQPMTRTTLGFYLAASYNLCIIIFSKGFSESLGAIDPLFSSSGCIGILLWGAAYAALAHRYSVAPAVSLVFAFEKAFYAIHWLSWMGQHAGEIPGMLEANPLTGFFYAIYGAGDLIFMAFFGWVAWTHRAHLNNRRLGAT